MRTCWRLLRCMRGYRADDCSGSDLARVARGDCFFLRHRSGHAVGQPLSHPHPRRRRRTPRAHARETAHQPRPMAGCQFSDSRARQCRGVDRGHAFGAARRLSACAAGHDVCAHRLHYYFLRAGTQNICGAAQRSGSAELDADLSRPAVADLAGPVVYQSRGLCILTLVRCARRRARGSRPQCRGAAHRGQRIESIDSGSPSANAVVDTRPGTRHGE